MLGHSVGKDISCETELMGSSNTSLQNLPNYSFYQKQEYTSRYGRVKKYFQKNELSLVFTQVSTENSSSYWLNWYQIYISFSDKLSCKSSEGLPRKRSIVQEAAYNDAQSISFISNGNVPSTGARTNVELGNMSDE